MSGLFPGGQLAGRGRPREGWPAHRLHSKAGYLAAPERFAESQIMRGSTHPDRPRRGGCCNASGLYQRRQLRVICKARNRTVPDLLDDFVDYEKRNEKPFTRDHRLSEAILDFDVQAGGAEDTVYQVLKLGPVDVV